MRFGLSLQVLMNYLTRHDMASRVYEATLSPLSSLFTAQHVMNHSRLIIQHSIYSTLFPSALLLDLALNSTLPCPTIPYN